MREITRIHIAKVAYDIEIEAKKDIETYISALEQYASDADILDDIEIRITELLAERGVQAGGVIAAGDVAAVRAQLGEPSDFAPEDAADAVGSAGAVREEPRRVYRDESGAVVGGVLAGFAKYFSIDPIWARLLFIVLLIVSFGTAIIVYLILWLIIPPASTATDKLRMSGRPVTLASIKDLVSTDDHSSERGKTVRRLLRSGVGVLLVLMAIGGLLAIVMALASLVFGFDVGQSPLALSNLHDSGWILVTLGLFVVSGLLFSALCFVLANAVFRGQWTKRIGTAVVAIIATGLVVFASGVGIGMYGYASEQANIADLTETSTTDLPATFKGIKKLTVAADETKGGHGQIEYIVSSKPRFELETMPGVEPQFELAEDGQAVMVRLVGTSSSSRLPWFYAASPILKIYGPALDSIEVAGGARNVRYYNEQTQPMLEVTVREDSQFNLGGRYDSVKIVNFIGASSSLDSAAIGELVVDSRGGAVTAGVVRSLNVAQPDACAVRDDYNQEYYVHVQAISSGNFIYNGTEQTDKAINNDCGTVVIGDNDPTMNRGYEYEN